MLPNCLPYQLPLVFQPVITWVWKLGFPRGTCLPPRLPAVMDGFTSSRVWARNTPAASFKMMLGKHIKCDGWWQSLQVLGWECKLLLLFYVLSVFIFLCMRCSWTCFVLKVTWLSPPLLIEGCLVKHHRTSLEMKTCLPLLPSLPLSANRDSHLALKMLLLRVLLYLCFVNESHQQH